MFKFAPKIFHLSLLLIVAVVSMGVGTTSCSKKVFPSGLEGNLGNNQKDFARQELKRKRVAKRHDRKTKRLDTRAKRPQEKLRKESLKEQERLIKEHYKRQTPDVQARMKESLKQAQKNNPPKKVKFSKKILFWKKNKCGYGS